MFRELRMDPSCIKAGTLTAERVDVEAMRPLVLAFIGYNERLTRMYFEQFACDNARHIRRADLTRGWIEMYDGTLIRRIGAGFARFSDGYRFDQVILADDPRMEIYEAQRFELAVLDIVCSRSEIPEEFRYTWYNVDAPMPEV